VDSDEFYRVGLACEAAPDIGCGIRAKPILCALKACDAIVGAWLSRSGTVIAVHWKSGSNKDEGLVAETLIGEQGVCIEKVVDAKEHRLLMESLALSDGWYSAAEVDRLSEEEAALIAARIVRRLRAKAALDPTEDTQLERSISEACERFLINESPGTQKAREEGLRKAILDAGGTWLTADHYDALEAVLIAGHRPLPEER